ncbi:MAG: DUF962 domain-containing protein [Proteobacteria bacterium]|nr:DUF962 domain-containing protein [Pseudomonadota bacterium]
MKNIQEWLKNYSIYHQHPTNILIHEICVPLIVFSILGLFWVIPIPTHFFQKILHTNHVELVNVAVLVVFLALIYYLRLSLIIAFGMFLVSLLMLCVLMLFEKRQFPIFYISLTLFILSWIGQFIGHKIEGKKPAFLTDLQFLLIGPAWILAKLYQKIGINLEIRN